MPLRRFKCPDGVEIEMRDCIAECRMAERCTATPILHSIAEGQRSHAWDGTPHVTELIGGTMKAYLQHTVDYAITPASVAYAQLGISHHAALEQSALDLGHLAEVKARWEEVTQGSADYLELIETTADGMMVYDLYDFKTWGSYRVKRAMGIVSTGRGRDKVTSIDPSTVDNGDVELQLNCYRVMLEDVGLIIRDIKVQITVRDGNTFAARNNGVDFAQKIITIPKLDDNYIRSFFTLRSQVLKLSMDNNIMPPEPCTDKESWGGRMCKDYCDVAHACPKGKLIKAGMA